MKILLKNILLPIFLLIIYSCNTTEPPTPLPSEPPKAVSLNLIESTCTEAFINVIAADSVLPVNIALNRDNNSPLNFTLTRSDTTVIDETLLPGKTYVYQTRSIIKGKEEIGDTLQVRTLDSTSHNFLWQKFEFGEGASSIFNDVAIIDPPAGEAGENNIYAVGEIYLNDSTGQPDAQPYSIAIWDGNKWNFKKLFYNSNIIIVSIRGILILNSNDIYFAAGSIFHWDGISSTVQLVYSRLNLPDPNATVEKLWGISNSSIFGIGNAGTIVHYQNGTWQKIESGTDWNIIDIWGDTNPFNHQTEIICGVSKGLNQPGPWSDIIRIKEDFTTEKLDLTGLGQVYAPLWFKSGIRYYIVGDGLYVKTYKDTTKWINLNENKTITNNFMSCISGTGLNNIVVAGAYGEFIHYNGSTWKSLRDQTSLENGTYYSVAVKGNIIAAVGQNQNKGVILIGYHQ